MSKGRTVRPPNQSLKMVGDNHIKEGLRWSSFGELFGFPWTIM